MAVKRDAAKERQREARMAASVAVRTAIREAEEVSARAQSAFAGLGRGCVTSVNLPVGRVLPRLQRRSAAD